MTKQAFNKHLYTFFRKNKRNFPWRDTSDPYHIMVSEYMLQQTQVSRVEKLYPKFIKKFPSIKKLADASQRDVLSAWQGLGYNRRALYLKKTAQIIQKDYKGIIPKNPDLLKTFPGIGINTAGSIAAFAFNVPALFIETNIRSVFLHVFFGDKENIEDKEIMKLIEKMIDIKNPRKWYSALMDYGAYIKKEYKNPSRKSKHHIKQSPFRGSIREVRGFIIKVLTKEGKIRIKGLENKYGKEKIVKAIENLRKEKIIKERKGVLVFFES